jgi:hypothetical protein
MTHDAHGRSPDPDPIAPLSTQTATPPQTTTGGPASDGPPAPGPPPAPGRRRPVISPEVRQRRLDALADARAKQPGQRFFGKGVRKVDAVLRAEDVGPYEDLMRRPDASLATLADWLGGRGYQVGRHAIRLHRVDFRARLAHCKLAAEMANEFNRVARRHGGVAAADATALHAEQRMMETLFRVLDADDDAAGADGADGKKKEFDPLRWQDIHKAIGEMAKNRLTLETIRGGVPSKLPKGKPAGGETPRGGDRPADARPLADRVRDALGLPPASAARPQVLETGGPS